MGASVQAASCPPVDAAKYWRFGASFDYLTSSEARDALSNGFNLQLERSFYQVESSDLSIVAGYRYFSGGNSTFDNRLNYYTLGFKWRFGPGANPTNDGFYGGIGVGAAFLDANIRINQAQLEAGKNVTHFEWTGLVGVNFAKSWYTEFGYSSPGDVRDVNLGNVSATLGYRF